MRKEELRIGNYFKWSEFASMGKGVDRITHGQQIEDYINFKEPIKLNPQWLLKFGFTQGDNTTSNDSFYDIAVGGSNLGINPDNGVVWITRDKNSFNNPACIDYVHQLQNLYFALTGKELVSK